MRTASGLSQVIARSAKPHDSYQGDDGYHTVSSKSGVFAGCDKKHLVCGQPTISSSK